MAMRGPYQAVLAVFFVFFRGDHTVLREAGTQFIEALIPLFLEQLHHQCMMSFQPA